jgi:hypothetical protein
MAFAGTARATPSDDPIPSGKAAHASTADAHIELRPSHSAVGRSGGRHEIRSRAIAVRCEP